MAMNQYDHRYVPLREYWHLHNGIGKKRENIVPPSKIEKTFAEASISSPVASRISSKRATDKPPPYSDHSFGSILCGICRKAFHPSRPEALLAHLAGHFDMRYDFHRCHRCEINFVREHDLRRHLLSAKRDQDCGYMFEHKQPCNGHHSPRHRAGDIAEDRRRYSLMRHSDDARFDFCYRIRNWEQLQLQLFYQKQKPQPALQREVSKRSKRSSVVEAWRTSLLKRPKSSRSLTSTAQLAESNLDSEITVPNQDVLGTMLLRAVCAGNFELVAALLHAGANIHMEDAFGFGPLHYAARYASPIVVRLIARAGPYINKPDGSGMSPLFHAVKIGRSEIVQCFLDLGATLHFDHLELSVLNGDSETAEILLDHWTDSNRSLDSLDVLLLTATTNRERCMVELLLEHGARALTRNENGNTAMAIASARGDREIVQLLFDHGSEPDSWNGVQRKSFHEAAEFRHIAMVEMLLSKGR